DSANGFLNAIGTYPAGWPVRMVWEHDGQQISRTIELDRLPAKLPPRLASAFKTDEIVTRAAAEAAASQPVEPMPPGNESSSSIARVQAATVQLYGAAIGRESGYATGVIVSPDGYVLTVVSLVLEARRLRAVTSDGRVWRCEVVHRDERRQLALLKLAAYPENVDTAASLRDQTAPARWEPPQLPDEAAGQTGDAILVIGNPFKVAQGAESLSVMRGIVAGRCTLDATAGTQEVAYRGEVLLLDVVTSNPGSAGSPVVDLAGRWVGLVGEIVTSRLTNTHLNYAYPAAEIRVFLDEARPTSTSTAPAGRLEEVFAGPGYHGVRLSRFAYRRALPFVRSVVAGSPAAKAGLKSDDLIISANGVAIAQSSVFEELCERLRAGDELSLTVKRGDVLLPVRFTLTEMPK
ncbi:MAG TPA: S1C family serine protease, partial [Phycisphaerae bacterium]|nr:S1C family serine protease [Phycisphaerae bacterium]